MPMLPNAYVKNRESQIHKNPMILSNHQGILLLLTDDMTGR